MSPHVFLIFILVLIISSDGNSSVNESKFDDVDDFKCDHHFSKLKEDLSMRELWALKSENLKGCHLVGGLMFNYLNFSDRFVGENKLWLPRGQQIQLRILSRVP